jgi:PAS domain S-box-containing protein
MLPIHPNDLKEMRDNAHQCITVNTGDCVIVYASPNFETVLGYAKGELLGQTFDVLIPEEKRALHQQHLADYLRNPKARSMGFPTDAKPLDVSMKTKGGEHYPVTIGLWPEFRDGTLYVTATVLFRR